MNKLTIKQIASKDAYPWLLNRHYAKRICSISYAFGAFENENLIGVCTFGTPSSSNLRNGICGKDWSKYVLELNRLCCESRKNLASFIVSNSIKLLPKPTIIVSYADAEQGHLGIVYQASNFIYTGLSAKRTDWRIKGLEHLHGTTIADLSRGQENRAEFMRKKYGEDFYLSERSRKHRYIYFHCNKIIKKELSKSLKYKIESYPKGTSDRYEIENKVINQNYFNF